MNIKTTLASVAAVFLLASCEDLFEDGNLQPDGSKPSLTINNPTTNQTVTATQGLQVYVTAVDKDQVENLNFTVYKQNSATPLLAFDKTPHKTVVEYDTLVSLPNITPGTYTLKVTAQDKRTNIEEKEVGFTVK